MAQTTDSSLATEMAVEEIEAIFHRRPVAASMNVGFHKTTHLNAEWNCPEGSSKQSAGHVGSGQTTHNPGPNPDRAKKKPCASMDSGYGKVFLPSSYPCISRVHLNLREENPKAFTPCLISIGPLHRGNEELQSMEKHKSSYLRTFLHVTTLGFDDCFNLVRKWEADARRCYAETFKQKNGEFAKIILEDGCFVVVFILVYFNLFSVEGDHPDPDPHPLNGQKYWTWQVMMDMTLLENQLPFFVIDRLYWFVRCSNSFNAKSNTEWKDFPPTRELVSAFLKKVTDVNIPPNIPENVDHFVDLLRFLYNPKSKRKESTGNDCREIFSTPSASHLDVESMGNDSTENVSTPGNDCSEIFSTRSATHLHAAGVKFDRATGSPMDIEFIKGVLKIHPILIQEGTEIIFRNLLAFEQLHCPDESITAYLCFLDKLIDTPSDVDLLKEAGVIRSIGGSNEDVCKLFNNIWRNANLTGRQRISGACKDLNGYYKAPWHKWKATLKREYLSTPWKVMGITVGFSLLVLTFIQAVCSILTAD